MAQSPTLHWKEFHPTVYPTLARVANVEGIVTIELTIDADGTMQIQNSTGHPVLIQAAVDSLKLSKLVCDYCGRDHVRFTVIFDFKFSNPGCNNSGLNVSSCAVLNSPNQVTITTNKRFMDDPAPDLLKKKRSVRCLYLWKCKTT